MRALRLLAPLAALFAAACGRGALEGGPSCPQDPNAPPISFSVTTSTAPAAVRRDLDMAQISLLRGEIGPDDGNLQGLTVVEHRLYYKTGVAVSKGLFRRRSCAWIETLAVDLTPGEATIYVPREYDDGSCEAEEILRHERQHEDIHRRGLEYVAAGMRLALDQAKWLPSRRTPLEVADRAEADKRFDAMILKVLQPPYDEFKKTLAAEQAVIDLPENYRWVSLRCPGWKHALTRGAAK